MPTLRELYSQAKGLHWNPETDIAWDRFDPGRYAKATCEAARRTWSRRAWSVYPGLTESTALLIRFCLESGSLGMDAKLFLSFRPAEEAKHLEVCYMLAERLGGYEPDPGEPGLARVSNHPFAQAALDPDLPVKAYIAALGALDDQLDLNLYLSHLRQAKNEVVRTALRLIAGDRSSSGSSPASPPRQTAAAAISSARGPRVPPGLPSAGNPRADSMASRLRLASAGRNERTTNTAHREENAMDAIQLLKNEHETAKRAFGQIQAASAEQRAALWAKLQPELKVHEEIEETALYGPVADEIGSRNETLKEWQEHHREEVGELEALIQELERTDPASDEWMEGIEELQQTLEQHIQEEEGDIWPRIQQAWDQSKLEHAGEKMETLKRQKMPRAA